MTQHISVNSIYVWLIWIGSVCSNKTMDCNYFAMYALENIFLWIYSP